MSKVAELLGLTKAQESDPPEEEKTAEDANREEEKLVFLKEAGAVATARAREILQQASEVEQEIEKIAGVEDDQLEEQFGSYVKIGQDMAYGYIAGLMKLAEGEEELSAEEAEIAEVAETIEAQVAEALATEVAEQAGPEALDDPEVQEEIAVAAGEATAEILEEALAGGAEEAPPEEEVPEEEAAAA